MTRSRLVAEERPTDIDWRKRGISRRGLWWKWWVFDIRCAQTPKFPHSPTTESIVVARGLSLTLKGARRASLRAAERVPLTPVGAEAGLSYTRPSWPHGAVFAWGGTGVRCAECRELIYRLRAEVRGDTALTARLFEPVDDSPPVLDGQPNRCPRCGFDDWFGPWWDAEMKRPIAWRDDD